MKARQKKVEKKGEESRHEKKRGKKEAIEVNIFFPQAKMRFMLAGSRCAGVGNIGVGWLCLAPTAAATSAVNQRGLIPSPSFPFSPLFLFPFFIPFPLLFFIHFIISSLLRPLSSLFVAFPSFPLFFFPLFLCFHSF